MMSNHTMTCKSGLEHGNISSELSRLMSSWDLQAHRGGRGEYVES